MATETERGLFAISLDLPMDGSFPTFAESDSFVDPRLHAPFKQTLAGKASPGASSQLLLTPSALWEQPSFDDASLDIFADPPDSPMDATNFVDELIDIKEEAPSGDAVVVALAPPAPSENSPPRRSSRATSSGSSVRNSSDKSEKPPSSASSVDSAAPSYKVKKPRATTKRSQTRKRGLAKEKLVAKEEEARREQDQQPGVEHLPEDDARRNKFLERNRVAASKCRQKKKEWMHSLEDTKAELEKRHSALHETLNGLAAEISVLKNHLMMHANCGDQNIDRWFESEARRFVASKTGQGTPARRPSHSASSASAETHHSRQSSVVQFSPTSSVMPPLPSPEVKDEAFSYDYMPDDMFADASL